MKPFQTVKDYLQGEKYPTLGSLGILDLSKPKLTTILGLE